MNLQVKHTAITQRYTVTTSELSNAIFKPVIHTAINFIWKVCMTRQQALLAIWVFLMSIIFPSISVTIEQKL